MIVVPAISRFLGIVITINYNEHGPPHFHARMATGEYPSGSLMELWLEPFRRDRWHMFWSGGIFIEMSWRRIGSSRN
jgi:hypothetical protein